MRKLVRRIHALPPWRFLIVRALCTIVLIGPWIIYGYVYFGEARQPRLVCLMYHRFVTPEQFARCDADEKNYHITAERFKTHLQGLKDDGYQCVNLDDAVAFIEGKEIAATRPVLITIDDGCDSIVTVAAPLLRKTNSRATVFVTMEPTSYVFHDDGLPQARLSDAALHTLDPAVFDVGTHGMTHRPMSAMDDETLERELIAPKRLLATLTGRSVHTMAVPGNWHSPRVADFAEEAGYRAMFVSDPGSIHPGQNQIGLPRLNVSGTMDAARLLRAISPAGMTQRRLGWMCNRAARRVLGAETAAGSFIHSYMMLVLSGYGMPTLGGLMAIWIIPLIGYASRGRNGWPLAPALSAAGR